MYLVDTSVWVDYLNGHDSPHVVLLDELLGNPIAVGINDLIHLEILQGARDQSAFDPLRRYFSGLPIHRFPDPGSSYPAAAQLFLDCRRRGITVRSTLDCLVAQCAIELGLVLLHNDRDFIRIGTVARTLRQKHFLS
jgi:hypothetical protein